MSAIVELVEQAMMSGATMIIESQRKMIAFHREHPDCSAGDMYRSVLGDFPAEFVEIRQSLVDDVAQEIRVQTLREAADAIENSSDAKTCTVNRTCHEADVWLLRQLAYDAEEAGR